MSENTVLSPNRFDPWNQAVTLKFEDGHNFNVTLQDMDMLRKHNARMAIGLGTQIGASWLLLIVLFLLTSTKKYKSPIFIANVLCLVTNAIRCVLLVCYATSSMSHPYAQLTGNFTRVSQGDLITMIMANIFTLIVTGLVMVALSLQVWVVCVTTVPLQRTLIMVITTFFACLSFTLKATLIIDSIRIILGHRGFEMKPHKALYLASYISQTFIIWLFSFVFTYKLGYAIVQRRKLNMPRFGPIQVVFIMGCQTMLIPALFSSFLFRSEAAEFTGMIVTVVVIFLPLSALWAGVVNETFIAGTGPSMRRTLFSGGSQNTSKSLDKSNITTQNPMGKSPRSSTCTCSARSGSEASVVGLVSPSDTEHKGYSIYVNRKLDISYRDAGDRV
ncbi:pheromone receptor [Phaeosphaeriaceae sp. PMI808]|nr:pheromone receptor [Phaeosphaeriaceae sp. PMI808]